MTGKVMVPVAADDPLLVAWEAYRDTPEYANTERWARSTEHTRGSLWAAFEAGFRAGLAKEETP